MKLYELTEIDSGSDIGRDINSIFTGFAIREFGEESFVVRRAENTSPETPTNGEEK